MPSNSNKDTNKKILQLSEQITLQTEQIDSECGGDIFTRNQLVIDRISSCEELALAARRYTPMDLDEESDIIQTVIQTMDIRVGFTYNNWFVVRLPLLLNKKKRFDKKYIRDSITMALSVFFKNEKMDKFDSCVIIFRYAYSENYPKNLVKDYDNIESKVVIDSIANYLLPSDSPSFCQCYYCANLESDSEFTEVYLVPKDDFINWLKYEPDIPKNGTEISAKKH